MSRAANIDIVWGDGEHVFRLAIGQLRELQEKCNAGPAEIYRRLSLGTWRLEDIRETLRLGLIGGGMKPPEATKLVGRYVDERPLMESIQPAQLVLMAVLTGAPDEPLGKPKPAKDETGAAAPTTTAASPSPDSTAAAAS